MHSNTTNLALLEAHRELTAEEMLLSVLLKVSGRPLVLGALDRRPPRRPPPDGASLAWWKVPYRATVPTKVDVKCWETVGSGVRDGTMWRGVGIGWMRQG